MEILLRVDPARGARAGRGISDEAGSARDEAGHGTDEA
jgi:hypothetical protein